MKKFSEINNIDIILLSIAVGAVFLLNTGLLLELSDVLPFVSLGAVMLLALVGFVRAEDVKYKAFSVVFALAELYSYFISEVYFITDFVVPIVFFGLLGMQYIKDKNSVLLIVMPLVAMLILFGKVFLVDVSLGYYFNGIYGHMGLLLIIGALIYLDTNEQGQTKSYGSLLVLMFYSPILEVLHGLGI